MAEELLINVGIGGDNVTKLTQDIDKFGTTVEQTAQGMTQLGQASQRTEQKQESLRSQIRKGREELALMTRGTAEYSAKLADVAGKQATFNRINKELKSSQATLGQTMTNVNNVVGGLAGGFSVATGVMNLFGIENDSVMKNLVKMQSLMSITSGLSSLNTAMRSFDGLKAVFGSLFTTTKSATDAVSELNMSNTNAATSAGTLAKESAVIGSNMAGVGAATTAAGAATEAAAIATTNLSTAQAEQSAVNAALIASNSSLETQYVVLQNLEQSYHISKFRNNQQQMAQIAAKIVAQKEAIVVTEATMTQEEVLATQLTVARNNLNKATLANIEAQATYAAASAVAGGAETAATQVANARIKATEERIAKEQAQVAAIEEKIAAQSVDTEAEIVNTEATVANTEAQIANAEAQDVVGKASESNASKLLGQIRTLVLWAAALYGVIAAITWLIKKINEIPKDLEIKIKLNQDALKEVEKAKEIFLEIANEQDMANTARAKGDMATSKQIESNIEKLLNKVKDGASKEYKLAKDKDAWLQKFFINELERQRQLAFNTALFKKTAEAEVTKSTGIAEQKIIRDQVVSEAIAKSGATDEKSKKAIADKIDREFASIKETYDAKGESTFFTTIGAILGNLSSGVSLAYAKANDKIVNANKELKVFNKISPYKVYEPIKDTNSGAGSESVSSTVGDNKPKLEKLDEYNKAYATSNEVFLSKYKGLSAEQKAINAAQLEQTGQFLNASAHQRLVYNEIIETARRIDLYRERDATQKELDTLKTKRDLRIQNNNETLDLLRTAFSEQLTLIKTSEGKVTKLNKEIFNNENAIYNLETKLKGAKTKSSKQHYQDEIDALKKSNNTKKSARDSELESLKKLKDEGDKLLKDKSKAEADLVEAVKSGANIDELKAKLDDINNKIIDSNAVSSQITRDLWLDAFDQIDKGIQQVGKTLSSLSNISDLMMQTIDNKTAHEKNQLELSDAYQKASSDKQTEMMYAVDKKNYESKKKLFEQKKDFDIGVVAIEAASSEMSAVKNLIDNGGAVSPLAWAAFAVEAAMIVATSVASIGEISSRKLEAPVPPRSSTSSSSGGSAVAIALNPTETAMTSKEENLNMMNQSTQTKAPSVVKVSDINNVQNKVSVRDNNSSY